MSDLSKQIEQAQVALSRQINANPGSREALEAQHGQVWDTDQLQQDFTVLSFFAPMIAVIRKSDNQKGTLAFQHNPRFYFGWMPVEKK